MEFYRYVSREYAVLDFEGEYTSPLFPNPKIILQTLNLVKETPKGYWICYGDPNSNLSISKKWVSKTSKKRYAYPTLEEALQSFIKRNESMLKILTWKIEVCKINI
jgi:hypothetical protein